MSKQTFAISHSSIRLEIRLEEIEKLHIHEEVIPDTLRLLTDEIRSENYLKHPVIVDSNTLVVLDGMHRLAATKKLGCHFIPVCLVDYENPHITVGCWHRVVNHPSGLNKLVESVGELGFAVEKCQKEKARKLVNERKNTISIISKSMCFAVYGPQKTIKETYDAIKQIESRLRSEGCSIGYETDSDAQEMVSSGKALSMFMVPNVSKNDVVTVALKGEVFAHKTTRHVIPVRPLFVNVSLELLCGGFSLKRANDTFMELLSKREVERLPPGQVLDRRYEEELYVFK
jgi:hypothetical protein